MLALSSAVGLDERQQNATRAERRRFGRNRAGMWRRVCKVGRSMCSQLFRL
jgi:hypothetical protein